MKMSSSGDVRLYDYPTIRRKPAAMQSWATLYAACGTRLQQSPDYAAALHQAGEQVVVAILGGSFCTFKSTRSWLESVTHDEPVLAGPQLTPSATLISLATADPPPMYFPLVSEHFAAGLPSTCRTWVRRPNSLIDWSDDGKEVVERAVTRGSSQVRRKIRMVERDGMRVCETQDPGTAIADMLRVEERSWKAARGVDMRQRNQAAVYAALVRQRLVTVSFLRDGRDNPVAFRLDSLVGNRLSCLKWSFDDAYRRYSPGMYLLTAGLIRRWGHEDIAVVDLYGAPDALKDMVYTQRTSRADVWCGDVDLGESVANERREFDNRADKNYLSGRGLRHAGF